MHDPSDFHGQSVLVTGGTRGIGLETGLSFGQRGALVYLTYRWGDHDESSILDRFARAGAPEPRIVAADVADRADTRALLTRIADEVGRLDVLVSNVSSAAIVNSFQDYTLKGLKQSISYSSWPLVAYLQESKAALGRYPGHVVALSSTGPAHFARGYDFVAASKAVLEVFVRYLNVRLRSEAVVINAVCAGGIRTESFERTFGEDFARFVGQFVPDSYWIEPAEVADTIVALCSGHCDAVSGQVINVDKGTTFFSNLMGLYANSRRAPT